MSGFKKNSTIPQAQYRKIYNFDINEHIFSYLKPECHFFSFFLFIQCHLYMPFWFLAALTTRCSYKKTYKTSIIANFKIYSLYSCNFSRFCDINGFSNLWPVDFNHGLGSKKFLSFCYVNSCITAKMYIDEFVSISFPTLFPVISIFREKNEIL